MAKNVSTAWRFRECFLSSWVKLENDQIRANLPSRPQVYRMEATHGVLSD